MEIDTCENEQLPLLDDDCLFEIFSYLELKELCVIAGLSRRFKEVARRVFGSKWKELSLTVENMRDLAIAIDYIRKFGPKTQSLRLLATAGLPSAAHNILFNIAVKYCGEGDSLTCLEMHGFAFNLEAIEEPDKLLARVKHLIFNECKISVEWFEKCPRLIELVLVGTQTDGTYNGTSIQSCPNLKVLKINGSESWVKEGLQIFLQRSLQLKTLELVPSKDGNRDIYARLLDFVPTGIENLTTVPSDTTQMTRFVSLKKLIVRDPTYHLLSYGSVVLSRMLATTNSDTLTSLQIDLRHFKMSKEVVDAITRLEQIKTLKIHTEKFCHADWALIIRSLKNLTDLALQLGGFSRSPNTDELSEMIQHGPNMHQLVFILGIQSIMMNSETYQKILNIVSRRTGRKTLHIIVVCFSEFTKDFNVDFQTAPELKISCIPFDKVVPRPHNDSPYGMIEYLIQNDAIESVLEIIRDRETCQVPSLN